MPDDPRADDPRLFVRSLIDSLLAGDSDLSPDRLQDEIAAARAVVKLARRGQRQPLSCYRPDVPPTFRGAVLTEAERELARLLSLARGRN